MACLSVRNIEKTFPMAGGGRKVALGGLSFDLEKGEILAVVGHNGSGKTTLLNCIRGAFPFDRGDIFYEGKDIRQSRPRVVSVYQEVEFGVAGSLTAMENLTAVMSDHPSFLWSFPCRRYRKPIHQFLNSVGLLDRFSAYADTPASDLSGGQRQQLAIAMAMFRMPDLLLLDEFVANLDPDTVAGILRWVRGRIQERRITTILVTHDHDLAAKWADRLLELRDGHEVPYVRGGKDSTGIVK